MKVKELVAELLRVKNQDADVWIVTEDGELEVTSVFHDDDGPVVTLEVIE